MSRQNVILYPEELPELTWNALSDKVCEITKSGIKVHGNRWCTVILNPSYTFHLTDYRETVSISPWEMIGYLQHTGKFEFELPFRVEELRGLTSLDTPAQDKARWSAYAWHRTVGGYRAFQVLMKFVNHQGILHEGGLQKFVKIFPEDLDVTFTKLAVHPDRDRFLYYWTNNFSNTLNMSDFRPPSAQVSSNEEILRYFQSFMETRS